MADAETAPKPPPHLRVSENEAKECDTCSYFKDGKCSMYNDLPVSGEWVCDSWEKEKREDGEDAETPQEDQPKTFSEARIRVREHFRTIKRTQ